MGQTQTPEQVALRTRAYELWAHPQPGAPRPSLRAIALHLGTTPGSVQYWKLQDQWEERTLRDPEAPLSDAAAIRALILRDLRAHLTTLTGIIRDETDTKARVDAIQAYARIAAGLVGKILTPGPSDADSSPAVAFSDDIPSPTPDEVPA